MNRLFLTKAIAAARQLKSSSAFSLKTRILLWVLLFVLIGIWGLAVHMAGVLRVDLERVAANHLSATADYIVSDLDNKIQLRTEMLREIAAAITPEMLAEPAKLNRLLELHDISRQIFPIGIFVANPQGVNIAEYPRIEGRLGGSVADRDYFRAVMGGERQAIGQPVIGRFWKQAISAIALPLPDASGATAGVLIGAMILSGPELFGQLEQTRIGKTGFFLVISPKDRTVVSATDRRRILTTLPPRGTNTVIDQRLDAGVESVMVGVNSLGVENLSVGRKLKSTGWIVIAGISSEEAFAPLEVFRHRIYLAALLISLALALVLRYILVRQLAPLAEVSNAMRLMSQEQKAFAALPVRRNDEIGRMVDSFNSLVAERKHAEGVAEQYRTVIQISPDGFWITDTSARILDANPTICRMLGYTREEILRLSIYEIEVDESPDEIAAHTREMMATGHVQFEARHRRKDGAVIDVEVSVLYAPALSEHFFAFVRDITQRKQNEAMLRQAASVFSNSQEGIMISDGQNLIVDVNKAFSHITGYDRAEVVGKNPGFLGSGRQTPEYYAQMWEALRKNDFWRGEIWNRRKNGEVYAEMLAISVVRDLSGAVQHYIGIFTDISQLKTHEAELHRIAHYDPLTGVPNRRLLADRLGQAIARARRSGKSLAVCYLDLDGFKPINDKYGHAAGDLLLVEVTERLKGVLRAEDTLARLGGDEFVLLFTDLPQTSESYLVFDRVLAAVSTPVLIEGMPISVSASIGVTLFPDDDVDADTLLRHADQAMYRAKEAGKNRYHLFDPDHDRQMQAHRYHLQRLQLALQNGEFVLHYQPKVDLLSGSVIGAEALIRWQHPEQGLLLPAEFLHYLAGSDLEIEVGEWVIDAVLQQIGAWHAGGLPLTVSANVSADHLLQSDFAERLQLTLARHPDVVAGHLELEILETAALADMEKAVQILTHCRQLGVRFALDDFGTGYSSLTYFRSLPVDILKIDQSFVRDMLDDPDDLGIVESVVKLAHAFNRQVIAEGVETLEHGAMLLHLGCSLAQGYGFARPMPAALMPAWVAQWQNNAAWLTLDKRLPAREDLTLLVAAQSHRHWIEKIVEHLEHPEDEVTANIDSQHCRFGRWYRGSGTVRYGGFAEFQALGVPHEQVHVLAAELVALARNGDHQAALQRLPELYQTRDKLLRELDALIEKVASTPA